MFSCILLVPEFMSRPNCHQSGWFITWNGHRLLKAMVNTFATLDHHFSLTRDSVNFFAGEIAVPASIVQPHINNPIK